ncbi:MoxR family ATPase, partial [Streptomyces sp. TRM76130]|nr:MoxR family ATPase [Streptomyces sp. TRM76130]
DAIARLQDVQIAAQGGYGSAAGAPGAVEGIGSYIRLGPLGTALLPSDTPRVLLIDELDKSDIDLPNDLLNVLEEGEFPIPELQ